MTIDRLQMIYETKRAFVQKALEKGDFYTATLILDDVSPHKRSSVFGELAQKAYNGRDDEVFNIARELVADGKFFDGLENLGGIRDTSRFDQFDYLRKTAWNGLDNASFNLAQKSVARGEFGLAALALGNIQDPKRFPLIAKLTQAIKSSFG